MARGTDVSSRERHLVVVFDICSSTTILEDLKRTDNLSAWRNVLIHLKDYLLEKGAELDMNLYKFIGDGWVLLFPDDVSKTDLCDFLRELSQSYEVQFEAAIRPLLSQEPNPIGLMFGIDAGELIRLELNGQVEYLGRAINVASRLQSYTKELPVGHQLQGNFLQEFVQLTGSATNRPGG
jgi:class 3 adenylate cyclase